MCDMKKGLLVLISLALTIFSSCSTIPAKPTGQTHTGQVTPEPTGQLPPEPTEQVTPEPIKKVLSVSEAQALLIERFGEYSKISYMPDMDKQEDGVQHYCFSVDYSGMRPEIQTGAYAYAWVNSVTEGMGFEEAGYSESAGSNLYTNIPDNMFPIPMLDGVVIPYDRFWPPDKWEITTIYRYVDTSVMESYQEQLRDAGFVDYGSVMMVESLWRYDRSDDGATLIVEMHKEETFSMSMYVSYLSR